MSYNPNAGTGIAQSIIDAKGDLIAGTADNTAARLAVGSDGTFLKANSAQSAGLEWATGSGGIGAVLFDSTLGADTASIDTGAAGVAGGYKTLLILIVGRTDEAVKASTVTIQFNADSGTNYTRQFNGAVNANPSASDTTADAGVLFPLVGSTYLASAPGMIRLVVPAYDQTTFFKIADVTGGASSTTAADGQVYAMSATWRNTAAITRVAVSVVTAAKKLVAGSRMTILGF